MLPLSSNSPHRALLRTALILLGILALSGCTSRKVIVVGEAHKDPPFKPEKRDKATLVIVGDTGKPGANLDAVRKAIKAEPKDLIIATGDLIYPWAPKCRIGELRGSERKVMELHVKKALEGLGAPVLIALGNHDVGLKFGRHPAQESCFFELASESDDLVFPDLNYDVDLGVALISVINTNALEAETGTRLSKTLPAFSGWTIIAGHHVTRTYHDKEDENVVLPWMRTHKLKPDLYVNGHAHFLQFGIYENIPSLTSGSGAKLRERPSCPPDCGEGQLWGVSKVGYALVQLSSEKMIVSFKDTQGETLWTWEKVRKAKGSTKPAGD